jgi:microcystin-dependent protein
MLVTNQTNQDYWFGPLHLAAGVGQTLTVDDTSATSLYLTDDGVADSINALVASMKITVSGQALPFPRPTGTPDVLHGDGSPEGLVYAGQGSLYLARTAGSAYNFLYTKTTGIHLNTGWLAINPGGVASPTGAITMFAGLAAPTGWLLCDGSAVSRATYADLFNAIISNKGAVTVTIAAPGVFTLNSHGLVVGDAVFLETSGSLPTGLSTDTTYYVVSSGLTSNNFQVSATPGGSAINTSGSQSGNHNLFYAPYGVAGSATTYNLPDLRGRIGVGYAASGGHADVSSLSANDGVVLASRRPKHKHTVSGNTNPVTQGGSGSAGTNSSGNQQSPAILVGPQTGAEPTDNPAYLVVNYIIKT